MTECLMLAYAERMPSVRAQRTLEAAEAAVVPHLKTEAALSWRARLARIVEMLPSASDSAFTLNGAAVTVRRLRRTFAREFKSGYRDE